MKQYCPAMCLGGCPCNTLAQGLGCATVVGGAVVMRCAAGQAPPKDWWILQVQARNVAKVHQLEEKVKQ